MDDEGGTTVPDDRRRASRRMSKIDLKARRKSTKSNLDVDEYLSRQVTKKKFSDGEELKSPEKKHKGKRLKRAATRPSKSSLKLETSLPTQDISKAYYKEVEGDLATACEILSDHERDIIWKSVDLFAAIPADYPPRRYINKLCCCDTCCMRCCDNADHKKTGFHTTLKRDASTDVPDNTELAMSGSDTSAISLLRSEQTLLDLAEFTDESKPVAVRAVVAAREAKRAIQAAKDFRTASKTVQSLECSTDSELKIRRQYVKDLMERAVVEAKMARDALAKYRVLKKAARRNPGVIAQITRNEDVMSLESLLSQDAETRRCRFLAVTPDGAQAREARRSRRTSAPEVLTRRDRSVPVKSAATLVRGADMAINKARQAAEEANKLQKISAAILSETRALKFPEQQSECLTRQPFYVQNDFLSNSDRSSDVRRYRNDSRSLYMSGQEGPYDPRFAGAAQINSNVVDREVTAAIPQRALNTGQPDGAKPLDEASKGKRRHDSLIEEKPARPNDSIMGGQDRQGLQLDAGLSARAFDDEEVSGEITKGHPADIPGEAEGHLSGESAEQDKVEALMSVADGAPEGGSLEVTQQTYSVDLDEKPEPAARKDINPAQQSFSQELPKHEVNDARAIQLESLPTPAPLRGPEAQDISFWDLGGPARLYPESRLILALSTAGTLWVLFIMFTTPMDPNKHTLLEIAPKKMTVSPQPRFLADRDTSDTWAIGTTTNATEDTTVDTTVDTTMTDEATSPTYPRSFYACNTPYCEREASYLRSLLTGNPCSNFYSYACKLETNLWKPSLGSSVSRDTLLGDQAEKLITSYILDKNHHDMKVAKDLLKACTDRGDSDSWHRMEMNELFFEYFGSTWPVDDKPVTSEGVWAMAGRLVRDLKLEAFAAISIDVHPENKAAHVIGIDEPNLLYRDGDWTKPAYTELLTGAIEQSIMFMNADANVRLHISNIKQTMVLFAKLVAGPNVRYMGVENYRLSKVRLLASGVRAFLGAAFLDTVAVTDGTDIMVKSPLFFERLEHAESSEFSPTNLLNYLGFRVMVYFGTFLEQRLLRQLRAIEAGFSYQENTTLERFCTKEVERILPAFYLRAYSLQMTKTSLLPKSWTSKLERTFIQQLQRVAWARDPRGTTAPSDSDVRMAKYKILSHTIQPSTPAWVLQNASFLEYHRALLHHLEVSLSLDPTSVLKRIILFVRLVQRERLREPWALNNTTTSSVFDSEARYDVQRKNVHVPMAIINASVPANSTAFVVHISRYGVRIFKALIPALYQEYVYEANQHDEGPLLYTDGYQERLRDTVSCLLSQYKLLAGQLKSTFLKGIPDLTSAGLAILEQTLALQQAYWTFQEFLNIKRVWRSDFRLAGLPQLSSEQLFFVAYALDNCEASDDLFRGHRFHTTFRLPPEDRVNFPLSQLEAFAQAFSCQQESPMIGRKRCPVFLNDQKPNA
ncbi:uncharacterized protein ISCGN_028179 [Ixodes scapularis]